MARSRALRPLFKDDLTLLHKALKSHRMTVQLRGDKVKLDKIDALLKRLEDAM